MVVIIVSIAYFYYNWYFFKYAEDILEKPGTRTRDIVLSFFINYALFYVCTILQFHLIVNWSIFFFFLLAETVFIYRGRWLPDAAAALGGTLIGLALNILFRDVLAILMNVPLAAFDNNTASPGNYKRYPIILGFAAASLVFQAAHRRSDRSRVKVILKDQKNLHFLAGLMVVMYTYLCLNLLVYYAPGNSLVLKLWTIKSSAAVLIGFGLAAVFTYRMCMLDKYRRENLETRQALENEKKEEQELRSVIYQDPLTGCGNRLGARKAILNAIREKRDFCLCFVDLNGLKPVNDNLGHSRGDDYLLAAVRHLRSQCRKDCDEIFRYGGDEFIVIYYDAGLKTAEERMRRAADGLSAEGDSEAYPFPMSISAGIVEGRGRTDLDGLIEEADRRMYKEKKAFSEKV